MRPPTRRALAQDLEALGLCLPHREGLLRHAREEILLLPIEGAGAEEVGQLGGWPSLPADLPWPRTSDGRALSFLARIELGALPLVDPDLPREGRLFVFFDTLGPEEGDDEAHGRALAIVWCRGGEAPPRPPPAEAEEFPSVPLRARRAWGPPRDPVAWPADPVAGEAWVERWNAVAPEARLLGHPDTLQEAMEGQCEARASGLDPAAQGGRLALDDPRRARWTLLLQLASDGAAGFSFGAGSGRLYVWIPRAALRAQDFGAALAIVQDT